MSHAHDYLFKFIVTGDSSVGKTAILRRFSDKQFNTEQEATVGVDFKTRIVKVDGKNVLLMIWDTAGQEAYRTFTRSYYRGSAVAILVYDITKRDSFENIPKWLQEVKNSCDNPNLGLVLVGNKSDLKEERQVSEKEAEEFANENHLVFFETSAKANTNVEDVFIKAAEHFYEKFKSGLVDITSDSQGLTLGPKQLSVNDKCAC